MGGLRLGLALTVGRGLGLGVAATPTGGLGRIPVGRVAGPGVGVVLDAMTGGIGGAALGPDAEPVRHCRPLLLSFAQRSM